MPQNSIPLHLFTSAYIACIIILLLLYYYFLNSIISSVPHSKILQNTSMVWVDTYWFCLILHICALLMPYFLISIYWVIPFLFIVVHNLSYVIILIPLSYFQSEFCNFSAKSSICFFSHWSIIFSCSFSFSNSSIFSFKSKKSL